MYFDFIKLLTKALFRDNFCSLVQCLDLGKFAVEDERRQVKDVRGGVEDRRQPQVRDFVLRVHQAAAHTTISNHKTSKRSIKGTAS